MLLPPGTGSQVMALAGMVLMVVLVTPSLAMGICETNAARRGKLFGKQ